MLTKITASYIDTRDVQGGAFSRRDEDENPWGEGENLQGGAGQKSA